MAEDTEVQTPAEKLNEVLAGFKRWKKDDPKPTEQERVIPEERDRGFLGDILGGFTKYGGKALGPVVDALALPGDMMSYYAYKHFGGSTSKEDRATRKQMARVHEESSWWGRMQKKQDIQGERESMFFGEKLITSIMLDPLTWTGFGLYGKLPGATGKLLGAADRSVNALTMQATQKTVRGLSIALSIPPGVISRLTTTGLKNLVDDGTVTKDAAEIIKGTLWGSQSLTYKTSTIRDEVRSAFGAAMDRHSGLAVRNFGEDATITKKFLDALFQVPRGQLHKADDGLVATRDAIEHVFVNKKTYEKSGWVKKALAQNPNMKLTPMKQLEINEVVNGYLRGIESFESAKFSLMTKMFNNPLDDKLMREVGDFLLAAKDSQKAFVDRLGTLGPMAAIEHLGLHAARQAADEAKGGIEAVRQTQGIVGRLLNGIDKSYTAVWRNTIERLVMRPFSEAVLAFPMYPVGNMIEDLYFMAAGGALPRGIKIGGIKYGVGYDKVGGTLREFNEVFQGVNIPGFERMRRKGREGLSDLAGMMGERHRGKADFTLLPSALFGQEKIGKVSVSVLGRWYMDASNTISEVLRRGFFVSRQEMNFRRLLAEAAEKDTGVSDFLKRLESVPQTNVLELSDGLLQKATLFAAKGDVNGLRKLVEQFTGPQIQQADMLERIHKLSAENVHPSTKRILEKGIEEGDYNRLVNEVIENAIHNEGEIVANSLEAQVEWFDNILAQFNHADLNNHEDLAFVMTGFHDALNQAEQIMTANMERTFNQIGDRFGSVEQKLMAEAYEKAASFKEVLKTKGRDIGEAYKKAARKMGINVDESVETTERTLKIVTKRWEEDIIAHAKHFSSGNAMIRGEGKALAWRHIRQDIWRPHSKEMAGALGDAKRAAINDALGVARVNVEELVAKYDNTVLAKAIKTPIGHGDLWGRREQELRKLGKDLQKLAKASRLSNVEEANIKAWITDLADSLDIQVAVAKGGALPTVSVGGKVGGAYPIRQTVTGATGPAKDVGEIVGSGKAWRLQRATAEGMAPIGDAVTYPSLKLAKEAAARHFKEEAVAAGYLTEAVQDVDKLRKALRSPWEKALGDTTRESKQAFTNYADEDAIDYLFKHIFPFWTYAKNIWPRLIQNGVAHPYANRLGGPQSGYWNSTDDGYLDISVFGMQAAPYRGLGIGRIKKAFAQEYEPRYTGVSGEVEKAANAVERWGFYPGFPWTITASAISSFNDGSEFEIGQNLPPMYESIVNTALLTGSVLGIDATNSVAETLRMGRFREAGERRIAFSLGYDPVNMTPEEKLKVQKRASAFAVLNSTLSLLRLRPEKYEEYKAEYKKAQALVFNTTVEELERLQSEGINIFEEQPLSPNERYQLRKLMDNSSFGDIQKEYMSINIPFKTHEERQIAEKKAAMFDEYDRWKDMTLDEQMKDDDRLSEGFISSSNWRQNRKLRYAKKGAVWEAAKNTVGLTDEDMERINKHPQDQIAETYFSVDIEAENEDGTLKYQNPLNGHTQWDLVTQEQNRLVSELIDRIGGDKELMLKEFQDTRLEGRSELEIKYMRGIQRGYMDWFNLSKAIEWFGKGNLSLLRTLRGIEASKEISTQDQRMVIASGAPRALSNLAGKTPGEGLLRTVVNQYRTHLIKDDPDGDLDYWLRRFYEITP